MAFERVRAAYQALTATPYDEEPKETLEPIDQEEISQADPNRLFREDIPAYNPSDLISHKGMEEIDKMRRDDQIKPAMELKKSAALGRGWTIESPEGRDSEDSRWELSDFTEWNLREYMKPGLSAVLKEALTGMDYGFSIAEKIMGIQETGPWAGRVCFRAIKGRRPHPFRFGTDEFGNLRNVYQFGTKGLDPMPPSKFVIYSHNMEHGNHYGRTDLEAAYTPWWFKRNVDRWTAMRMEQYGVPPKFLITDSSRTGRGWSTKVQNILKKFQANLSAHIPVPGGTENMELKLLEDSGQGAGRLMPQMLDAYDTRIARAVLVPSNLGMTPEQAVGSQARAVTIFGVFIIVIEEVRQVVAEDVVQDQIIKPLIDINWGPQEQYPRFKFLPLSEDFQKDVFATWLEAVTTGVIQVQDSDEEHLRKTLGLPEREEREDEEPPGPPPPEPQSDPDPEEEEEEEGEGIEDLAEPTQKQIRAVRRELDALEAAASEPLRKILIDSRDSLVAAFLTAAQGGLPPRFIDQLRLKGGPAFRRQFDAMMDRAFASGTKSFGGELAAAGAGTPGGIPRGPRPTPNFAPKEALRFLSRHAATSTGIVFDSIMGGAKVVLENHIEFGNTAQETAEQLREVFEPHVGDPNVVRDGKIIEDHRLQNIIRTNTTKAYNKARLVEARRIKEDLHGVRYQAIDDGRTTDVCLRLNGRIFKLDDPALDRLTPPNHFQCRSLLVPVTLTSKVNEEDFMDAATAGAARKEAGKGFV